MAAKKKAASKRAAKRPAKKPVARPKRVAKKTVKRSIAARSPKAPSRTKRKSPETLRLRSFTPSLTVNDLPTSISFYTDGLGFIISERWADGDTLKGVMLKAGTSELGLSQDDWRLGKDRPKGLGFRLWCETVQSVDAIAARVKAAGFKLIEEPTDHHEWKVRSIALDDPDGFHITIAQDI